MALRMPRWARPERPEPGREGFSSLKGEGDLAKKFGGRRRAMSGAGDLPYDVATERWLIDSKETSAASFSVKRDAATALTERAIREGRRPMFTITFWQEGQRAEAWAVVRLNDLHELEGRDDPQEATA